MKQQDPEKTEHSSLGHEPGQRWSFDESVTRVFTDMLQRSIPQYGEMRHLVFELGRRFVQPGTDVVDLGCSRGDALAPLVSHFGDQCRYVGLEMSQSMLAAARSRFASQIEQGIVSIREHDLCGAYVALEGVLVPQTAAQNEALLDEAGFSQVDCFWRWMNFAGWIAIR